MQRHHPDGRRAARHLAIVAIVLAAAGCETPDGDGDSTSPPEQQKERELDPLPVPKPLSLRDLEELPNPDEFSSGSSSFWRAYDEEAVRRYTTANEQRIVATRMKDADASAAAAREYDRYFSLHRRYHERYIQAEAIERMTALGIKVGTSIRP